MKILPITTDDLLRVLAGRTMGVATKDGEAIALRLYTPEEVLREFPNVTVEQAENLTRPYDLFAIAESLRNG